MINHKEGVRKKELKCEVCGKYKPDVCIRECCYVREIHDEESLEQICDDCEHEHAMDV